MYLSCAMRSYIDKTTRIQVWAHHTRQIHRNEISRHRQQI
jgi:hypothetical protein